MKRKRITRILSIVANLLLLCSGSVVSLILSQLLHTYPQDNDIGTGIFAIITFELTFVVFVVEFISMLRISDSTFHTMLVALFLVLYTLFSPDMCAFYALIGFPRYTAVCEFAENLWFIGVELSTLGFFQYTYPIKGKKISVLPIVVAAAACGIAYIVLAFYRLRIIAHFAFLVSIAVYFIILQVRAYLEGIDDTNFLFSSSILFACAGMHTMNVSSYTGFIVNIEGLSSGYVWICLICFVAIYIAFNIRTERAARKVKEYQLQAERLKMKVLIGQIKPHFIFNALTAVKSTYHQNLAAGDRALQLFSEYLRESLTLIDTEIISFEQELQNVSRYIDFINTNRKRPFNIIYNIDVTDFSVPAFSLQPFIENAVKYSKVNEIEDGYIMISTSADGDMTELKITDNGVGFDTSAINNGSHGINNSCERFKMILNTVPVIHSEMPGGTEITIRIQRNKEDVRE